jgi:hypothetical protein
LAAQFSHQYFGRDGTLHGIGTAACRIIPRRSAFAFGAVRIPPLPKPPKHQGYYRQGGKAGHYVDPEGQGFGAGVRGFFPGLCGFRGGRGLAGGVAAGRAAIFEKGFLAGKIAVGAADRLKGPAAAGAVFGAQGYFGTAIFAEKVWFRLLQFLFLGNLSQEIYRKAE